MDSLRRKILFALLVLPVAGTMTQAQTTTPNVTSESTNLQLSPAQKQTIYTSITNLNQKNESLANFQPIVGATVPENVKLEPMPKTITELTPRTVGYEVAMISGAVVIVDPRSRRVVEVIVGEKN